MSSANLKSEIAPKGMKFNVNDFIISDKYATILTIISYPKTIQPGFLSNVTNIPGIKVVVKHIPIPFSSMQKMLNREIVDLKDRLEAIKEGQGLPKNWKIDDDLQTAIDYYLSFKPTSALLLEDTRFAINKLRTLLREVDLKATDDKGKPIYTLNTITSTIK